MRLPVARSVALRKTCPQLLKLPPCPTRGLVSLRLPPLACVLIPCKSFAFEPQGCSSFPPTMAVQPPLVSYNTLYSQLSSSHSGPRYGHGILMPGQHLPPTLLDGRCRYRATFFPPTEASSGGPGRGYCMAHALCAFAFAVPFSLVAWAQGGGGGRPSRP